MPLSDLTNRWNSYRISYPQQVEAYEKQFGDPLDEVKKLKDDEDEEAVEIMEEALKRLSSSIAVANSTKEMGAVVTCAAMFLSSVMGGSGMMLDGPATNLGDTVQKNEAVFCNLANELVCLYGMDYATHPLLRFAAFGGVCMLSTDTANRRMADKLRKVKIEEEATSAATFNPRPCPPAPQEDNVAASRDDPFDGLMD